MLCSLIKQLSARRPDMPEPLKALGSYKEKGERPETKTLEAVFAASLCGFSDVRIILDGLDECPFENEQRQKLLDSITRILAASPKNLHLFCTSRKESDIEAAWEPLSKEPHRVVVDSESHRESLNRDIGIYIDHTLDLAAYQSWPVSIKVEARRALIEKADGM